LIAEEAARFRALSPEDRIRVLDEMFRTYHLLLGSSPQLAQLAEEEEERGRAAIKEFIARHRGHGTD